MKNILRNSNFGLKKWCAGLRASLLLALTVGWMGMGNNSFATLNYFEDFTTAGVLTANGWTAFSSAGTSALTASSPGLSYAGLASSGNAVGMTTGEDAYKSTATSNTTGDLYASALINVSAATTGGDYFLSFYSKAATGGGYFGRVFVKSATGGYVLGLSKQTSTGVYDTVVRSFGTTYLVVVKMVRVGTNSSTTTDDTTFVFVNPVLGATEPSPTISGAVSGADTYAGIDGIALRQASTAAPTLRIGAIRYGTTWADVTPAGSSSSPSVTPSVPTLTGFTTTAGTASAAQTFTVTGANLSADVTVTAPTGFEVATDGATFAGSKTLTQSAGAVSGTISVRIAAATAQGSPSGNVTLASTGATTANVAVSGTVTAAGTPLVTVSPTSATGLTNYVGQVSAPTNYTVTGTNLGGTNLVVTASTNAIEVSTNSSTGYTNSFSLAPSVDGTLTNTVYVRISALAPAGAVSATVSNVSGLASNNFTVSGTVTTPALTLVLDPTTVAESAGTSASTGTVGIPASLGSNLVVNLVSTNTAAATVPVSVTIPTGQTSATFPIAAVANSSSYGTATTAIEASNSNYTTASATLTVTNVDVPTAPLAAKGWINEFHYDNTGTDAGEFVEIVLADTTPTTNVSVILYNGGTAGSFIPYGTASDLASFTKGVSANGYTIYSKSFPVDGIQNGGTDGIALIIDNVVEEFISYEGSAVATSGAAAGYTSKDIGISEAGSEVAGGSLYRYGPGSVGRDFAWAKATVATPGQVNPGQNLGATGVQGTGTLAIANGTANSAFVTQNIFPKATAGQTVSLTLTGTLSSGTISSMSVVVPAAFTGLSAVNVAVSGTGAGTAVKTLSGSTLTITGLVVDQLNPVTINIAGLTTPETETAGDLTKDGNYPFTVQTGVEGNLQAMLLPTIAVVTIPIANLGDVDANGVSLDVGKTVAVQGVCTEENFNSTSSTSAYLQSGQPDGILKAGINVYYTRNIPMVRGTTYVAAGVVANYFGVTEIIPTSTAGVVSLGVGSPVPTAVTLTLAELAAKQEAYEGSLVRVVELSKVSGTWAYSNVNPGVVVSNGGNNVTVLIKQGSLATIEPVYPASVAGIYGQNVLAAPFTGGGQILPRDEADVESAPGLRLAFAEPYLYESTNPVGGGTIVSGALTVSRTGADTSGALVVALSASPTGLLQFPASVTIPAGQESASVTVEAIDNSDFNAAGFTNVVMTASALGSGLRDGSTTVMILEDEASAPADTVKPLITLIGANPQLVANGGVYTDLKATVTDNVDASREITGTGTVNTAVAGDYTITYNASDAAGNAALQVTRTVRVAAPLGSTFAGAYPGKSPTDIAPNGLSYLANYGFGGSEGIAPTLPVMDNSDPTKLKLIVVFRTDDPSISLGGQTSSDLALAGSWSTSGVSVDPSTDASPVPANTVRKVISADRSGSKRFLRATITK